MNYVAFSGNVTNQPQFKQIGQSSVVSFGVAINKKRKDGQQITTFVEVSAWGKLGQFASVQLSKGSKVLIEGELHYSQWSDNQTGKNMSKLDVTANRIEPFVWNNNQNQGNQNNQGYNQQQNQSPNQNYNQGNQNNYNNQSYNQPPNNPNNSNGNAGGPIW